jgi:GAF domain-containing protein
MTTALPDPALLDPYSRLRQLLRALANMLTADVLGAYVLDGNGEWLSPVQGYHLPPDRVDVLKHLRISVKENSFYASGLGARQPVFTGDAHHDRGTCESLRATVPHRAEMFVPIVLGDHTVGGIIAAWVASPAVDVQARDPDAMETVATEAGFVIQNARLFEAYAAQVEAMTSWRELADAMQMELMRAVILTVLDAPIGAGYAVDVMEVYWRATKPTELHRLFRCADGNVDPRSAGVVPLAASGLVGAVIRTKRAIRTRDAASECLSRMVAPSADNETYRHWLGVPVIAGDDVVGVLAVSHRQFPFTSAHEASLRHTAHLLALALCGIASPGGVAAGHEILEALVRRAKELREAQADAGRTRSLDAIEASVRNHAAALTRASSATLPARYSPSRRS